jgi:hypothetical protein
MPHDYTSSMAIIRIFRDMKWTPEDRARHRAVREWF